jgi:hypothetical protein
MRGKPTDVGSTTTETGLKPGCELDANPYPKSIEVSDERQASDQHLRRSQFNIETDYTISRD